MSADNPGDDTSTTTDLFCECGSFRRPDGNGQLTCARECGQPAVQEASGDTFTIPQQEQLSRFVSEDAYFLPTTTKTCPECGNDRAEFKMQQTRSADEPGTQLYRCTACKHRWRSDG